jgi:predicted ferric reductase
LLEPLLSILQPILSLLYSIRFQLAQPFNTTILPKWIPIIITTTSIPYYYTYGELLLSLPLVVLILAGYQTTFVAPSLDSSGEIAGYAILLTFLLANKSNSIFALVFGIPFERLVALHKYASVVAVVLSIFHGYVAYYYGDSSNDSSNDRRRRHLSSDSSSHWRNGVDPDWFQFLWDGGTNLTGSLIVVCMAILILTSFFRILMRQYAFNLWMVTHVLLSVGVIAFCILHSVVSIWFVFGWWMLDVILRYVVCAACRYPTKCTLKTCRPDVVQVEFDKPKSFTYRAGQFVQIAFPALNVLEFHPISISSAPHERTVTLHVRVLGDWSRRLYRLAEKQSEHDAPREVSMLLEGPYGNVSVDMDNRKRYKLALLLSGGIGVTHCQSVGKALLHRGGMKKLHFVWSVRDINMVHDMPPVGGRGRDIELAVARSSQDSPTGSFSTASDESNLEIIYENDSGNDIKDSTISTIQTDVYLTGTKSTNHDDVATMSALPSYATLYPGRPDVDSIVAEMKRQALELNESHVAVFACGPHALLSNVQEACRVHSSSVVECGGVKFDLHLETFDM